MVSVGGRAINSIRTEGGWEGNPSPYGFLPFIKKIFLQPIPEILVADTPMKIFFETFV